MNQIENYTKLLQTCQYQIRSNVEYAISMFPLTSGSITVRVFLQIINEHLKDVCLLSSFYILPLDVTTLAYHTLGIRDS